MNIVLLLIWFYVFTFPDRTVSFTLGVSANSDILTASFVFKYSSMALIAAVILPALLPRIIKIWTSLEDNRRKKKRK